MRQVSDRWRALVAGNPRWETQVWWSNNGGKQWWPARYRRGGSVTAASTSTVRWECSLKVDQAPFGADGINPYTTRLMVLHGLAGEPLLPMGRYLVDTADWSTEMPSAIEVTGSSYEVYLQRARFLRPRTLGPASARTILEGLIREVLPDAQVSWKVSGSKWIKKIEEPRDRWAVIDGVPDSATSIARALAARVYAGPAGEWVVAPVPTLEDPTRWEAAEGPGGVLLSHGETLSNEAVRNAVVVNGISDDGETPPFAPGVAVDDDPQSLTYYYRSPDEGGFGPCPRFYASSLLSSTQEAQKAANGMLAPYLGLRQQIRFSRLHDPSIEPGDVGLVHTRKGDRRVIPDSIRYSLDGLPMEFDTRMTATRLAGSQVDAPEGSAEDQEYEEI